MAEQPVRYGGIDPYQRTQVGLSNILKNFHSIGTGGPIHPLADDLESARVNQSNMDQQQAARQQAALKAQQEAEVATQAAARQQLADKIITDQALKDQEKFQVLMSVGLQEEAEYFAKVYKEARGRELFVEEDPYKGSSPTFRDTILLGGDPNDRENFMEQYMGIKRAGGVNVSQNVNTGGDPLGRPEPPKDTYYVNPNDPNDYTVQPFPGHKDAQKMEHDEYAFEREKEGHEESSARNAEVAQNVYEDFDRGMDVLAEYWHLASGPAGQVSSWLTSTPAGELRGHLESVRSNIGIDTLLQIKKEGSGLGQVPQRQLEELQRVLGQLDIKTPPKILRYNMQRAQELYADIVRKEGGDPKAIYEARKARYEKEWSRRTSRTRREQPPPRTIPLSTPPPDGAPIDDILNYYGIE